jgi:hypothetical protein
MNRALEGIRVLDLGDWFKVFSCRTPGMITDEIILLSPDKNPVHCPS